MSTTEVKPEDVKIDEKSKEEEKPKVEEEKTDEQVKPKKTPSEMSLLEVVMDFIKVEKKDIVLTPKVESLLLKLPCVDKKHLDNVETFFNQIMQDKKIDMKDLPALMGLVQELFIMYNVLKAKANAFDIGATFRVMIQLLLQYKSDIFKDTTEEQKKSILESLDMILELCTQMIELKDTQKKLRKWFSFLPCVSA
mgnify:CR=1 FL=1